MKKVIHLTLALVLCTTMLTAQTVTYDFEDRVMPEGFTLINVDMLTPNEPDDIVFADSAWIVIESGLLESYAALSLSWYVNDAGPADDWMILPKHQLGDGASLSWTAQSTTSSGNYPDSYQVLINTGEPTAEDFASNGAVLLSVTPEEHETAQMRTVDLADYAGQSVHIAFRNITPSGDALLIDDISISDVVMTNTREVDNEHFQMKLLPNPASGSAVHLDYQLEKGALVDILLRNLDGKLLATYPQGQQPAGAQQVFIPTDKLSPGTYLVSVQTAEHLSTMKLVVQ